MGRLLGWAMLAVFSLPNSIPAEVEAVTVVLTETVYLTSMPTFTPYP